MKNIYLIVGGWLSLAVVVTIGTLAAYGAPFVIPKTYSAGDAITAADRNTELAALAVSINNITAAQITDSCITSGKLAAGAVGVSNISAEITFISIGTVTAYAGDTLTDTMTTLGWQLCDGRAVSRTTYAQLYAIVGTTYGPGNGSTTFNLPDLRARIPVGANPTVIAADAGDTEDTRSIRTVGDTGGVEAHTLDYDEVPVYPTGINGVNNGSALPSFTVNATKPHINTQPYIVMQYIIYAGRP